MLARIVAFSLSSLVAFISLQIPPFAFYTPQLLALSSLILILLFINHKPYFIYLFSFFVTLLVFWTDGLSSPVFFLIYFLLFTIAFQNHPLVTLAYSLVLVLLLAQYLNSNYSLLTLSSMILITPMVYFIGRQTVDNQRLSQNLAASETDFFLWLHLKFKTGITVIIDAASQLLSQPQLTPSQKDLLRLIKDSSKNLLHSSRKLSDGIDQKADDKNNNQ